MISNKWLHSDYDKRAERAHTSPVIRDVILSMKEQCRKCLQRIQDRRHDRNRIGSPLFLLRLVVQRASEVMPDVYGDGAPLEISMIKEKKEEKNGRKLYFMYSKKVRGFLLFKSPFLFFFTKHFLLDDAKEFIRV